MVVVLVQVSKEFDSLLQVVELVQHLLGQGGTHLRPAQYNFLQVYIYLLNAHQENKFILSNLHLKVLTYEKRDGWILSDSIGLA